MADRTLSTDNDERPPLREGPTPDSIESPDNVGRRAVPVNGAVAGSGAGAGGGGGPEDFDSDPQGGGGVMPKPVENDAPYAGGDARVHGSH